MHKVVLDVACGSRMFWFDRHDARAVYCDLRRERHIVPDRSSTGGVRTIDVHPDVQSDFRSLPFGDAIFSLVIFDPPHFQRNGDRSWIGKKYGTLTGDWRTQLRTGFAECWRVLRPHGTLVFKWNEDEIAVSEIIALAPTQPLIGNRYGKHYKSHFLVFVKEEVSA